MKEILISIRPEWVEKILNGEKTIEIRKTMPRCELPAKVYIYCTKPKSWFRFSTFGVTSSEFLHRTKDCIKLSDGFEFWGNGIDYKILNRKVVAEFTLNKVQAIKENQIYNAEIMLKKACLTTKELNEYTNNKTFYAWHIDDLKIYDELKELSDFYRSDTMSIENYLGCYVATRDGYKSYKKAKRLKRPPQSWQYVKGEL